jgi:SeqA protein C-terminal domain
MLSQKSITPSKPPLDAAAFKAVCEYAVTHLVPPDDVIRIAAGRWSREPFLIPRDQISASGKDKKRFLSILSALYRGSNNRFDKAAADVHGTRRKYFGRTANEVSSTGSSNWPEKIPDSPWYVSINNSAERKWRIIYELMTKMQFSSEYAQMIASICLARQARLPGFYRDALAKLTSG